MADTEDLKSSGSQGPCGFESRPRHLELTIYSSVHSRHLALRMTLR